VRAAGSRFGFTPREWRALRALASPAAALRTLGFPPLLLDLEADRRALAAGLVGYRKR